MLKDIPNLKVTNIGVAIVPREGQNLDNEVDLWDAYLINLKKDPIFNVIVNVTGYGNFQNKQQKTAPFRVFIDDLAGNSFTKIEAISSDVFHLANQYWISFRLDNHMLDRKYIFVPESISEENFTEIPLIGKKGVMIL